MDEATSDLPIAPLPIAIVGGGFSGTLLAVNLLRRGARVVLVEQAEAKLGKGLAFGAAGPGLLLNVRAANMSAYPDDPGHFLRWLGIHDADEASRFVPRATYGEYLRDQLLTALAAAPDRLTIRENEGCAARCAGEQVGLTLCSGEVVTARALVLALGNLPPHPFPAFADLSPAIWRADPWAEGATAGLDGVEEVLLLGTGLTAVDMALTLDAQGWPKGRKGRITALSRRGLAPRAHAGRGPAVSPVERPVARGSWLVRAVRERAEVVGWRVAVDELRPHTQDLWRLHDAAAQTRFLRHLRPYWDVHRHRLAPQVAARVAAMEAEGRLRFVAGKVIGAAMDGGAARVTWRPRGRDEVEVLRAGRILNCTGAGGDLTRASSPLIRDLLAAGRIRSDPHRLGLDVDPACRARDAGGQPQAQLYAVGPVTKGEAWEIIAVPDIRRQVWELARLLTDTHWVGGEGL